MQTRDGGGSFDARAVRFDRALASGAADALKDVARQLQQVMATDVPLANAALANWYGPHAERFSGIHGGWRSTTAPQLIAELHRWARTIDAASATAAALEARRDRATGRP